MDSTIVAILVQDGIVNGAIYALLALSLVLVFAVTRVVFVPQGEFVAYGALTYAALRKAESVGRPVGAHRPGAWDLDASQSEGRAGRPQAPRCCGCCSASVTDPCGGEPVRVPG